MSDLRLIWAEVSLVIALAWISLFILPHLNIPFPFLSSAITVNAVGPYLLSTSSAW
jgi:hypothetical protein